MDLALTDNLTAGFNYSYIDAKFKVFDDTEGGALFGDQSMAGRQTPNTSRNEFSLYGRYNRSLNSGWDGYVRGDLSYSEGKYAQAYNLASTGDATRLNLRFGVERDNMDISLYIRNVTDDDTPSSVIRYIDNKNPLPSIPPGSGLVNRTLRGFNYSLADGRRIGVDFRYRF